MLIAGLRAQQRNRGIGLYPRALYEYTAPKLICGNNYRDLALHRSATASSSIDCNLTAQLVTDGLISHGEPVTLTVSTNRGIDTSRDRLKGIDGSCVSPYYLYGQKSWLQYLWTGMTVHADTIRICFETAYRIDTLQGWSIEVDGTVDGKKWNPVGSKRGGGLPGYQTMQTVPTDPQKQVGLTNLPLRRGILSIPIKSNNSDWRGLRLRFIMPSAVWWRIYEIDEGDAGSDPPKFELFNVHWKQHNMSWLPSEHFYSAWIAHPDDVSKPVWLKVDLGSKADINLIRIHWLYAAKRGEVQISDDDNHWNTVSRLSSSSDRRIEEMSLKAHGRYVRLMLMAPQGKTYGISELEVLGSGGIVARPANSLNLGNDKLSLNCWEISRDINSNTEQIEGMSPWIEATVPGTALTSYINVGAVPETTIGNNMRQISESFFNSDFTYKADIFVNNGMLANGEASLPMSRSHKYLCFDGIDWRAVVELNGKTLGRIDGAFTRARFDISNLLAEGHNQVVVHVQKNAHPGAVKIKNATSTDLNGGALGADNPTFEPTIGWDWITSTPGRCMGIWNDVYVMQDEGLSLSDPLVTTRLSIPDTLATMMPVVRVSSTRNHSSTVILSGWIGTLRFSKQIIIEGGESRDVSFAPEDFPQLSGQRMHLWWPNNYGEPYLYDAGFALTDGNDTLYTIHYKAGVRQISSAVEPSPDGEGNRFQLYVNGVRVDPLGGNWGFPETNLRYRGREYDNVVRYHRDMNMNMIRNWVGQTGDEEFYDACDRYGILVWQDFWLANPWDGPDPDDETMFVQNARDMISKIRRHPSVALYCGRNEGYPPESLQNALRSIISELHPQLSYIGSSADGEVGGHGPYGIKPTAWYFSHLTSKLHSEEGMQNIPTWESLQRFMSLEGLSSYGDAWGQHDFSLEGASQGKEFNAIMKKRFGETPSVKRYTELAQWLNYDGHRAMFESRQVNRQGLLMWMSHPCWPSMVWQTYDYYQEPTAGYFAIKKACEPLHIQWNPVKHKVEVVNTCRNLQKPLVAQMQIMNTQGKVLRTQQTETKPCRDTTIAVISSVELPDEDVWFLRLRLLDGLDVVSDNFYVEAREPDNLIPLTKTLGKAQLRENTHFEKNGEEWRGYVDVVNTSSNPALFIRLNLLSSDGEQILPVLYSDNYFALMPGEQKRVDIRFSDADSRGLMPHVVCTPINK